MRSDPGGGMGQAARTHSLRLLRCCDDDRANADSVGVFRGHATARKLRHRLALNLGNSQQHRPANE